MLQLTELLQESVDKIVSVGRSNSFTLTFSLRNYDNPGYINDDIIIDQLRVEQQFSSMTTDDIQVNLAIKPVDLLELVKYQSSMYATIVIEYVDTDTGEILLNESPEIYEYRVFVHDLENVAKRYNISAFKDVSGDNIILEQHVSTNIDITIQLIHDSCYVQNKSTFIGSFSNTTIEKAIKYIATNMGFSRINMIPAHNTVKYHRVTIPPEFASFDVIFEYIQKKYGVYVDGLCYYYTGGVLYIYPQFDVRISRIKPKDKLQVLKVNPKQMMGLPNYWDQGSLFTIVSNTDIIHKSLTNISSENDGNSKVFTAVNKVIDGKLNISESSITHTNISLACTNMVDHSIKKGSAIPKFKKDTMNLFEQTSDINGANTELLATGWPFGRLFKMSPGMEAKYIYDEDDVTMMVSGILEGTVATVQRHQKHGDKVNYSIAGSVILRLDLETNKTKIDAIMR